MSRVRIPLAAPPLHAQARNMGFVVYSLTRISLVLSVAMLLAAGVYAQNAASFVPGELLVKYSPANKAIRSRAANRAIGATVLEDLGTLGWQRVQLPSNLSVDQAAKLFRQESGVEYAQPNFYYHLLATPNDPQFSQANMYGLFKISAPSAWDRCTDVSLNWTCDATVVVADIDTGLHYTHQDLAANTWTNPGEIAGNGFDDDGNGFIDDVHGWDFRF